MDKEKQQTLDCWAIVELMGHQRIAGRVTERSVAGVMMIQVDVPEVAEWPAFTRLLGGGAIYAINPCDEESARSWARTSMTTASPITSFEGRGLLTKMAESIVAKQSMAALPAGEEGAVMQCDDCGAVMHPEDHRRLGGICENCIIP